MLDGRYQCRFIVDNPAETSGFAGAFNREPWREYGAEDVQVERLEYGRHGDRWEAVATLSVKLNRGAGASFPSGPLGSPDYIEVYNLIGFGEFIPPEAELVQVASPRSN